MQLNCLHRIIQKHFFFHCRKQSSHKKHLLVSYKAQASSQSDHVKRKHHYCNNKSAASECFGSARGIFVMVHCDKNDLFVSPKQEGLLRLASSVYTYL